MTSGKADFTVEIVTATGQADHTVAVIDGISGLNPNPGDTLQWDGNQWVNTPGGTGAHAASHAFGGGDQVTLTEAQITSLVSDLAAKASNAALAAHEADTTNIHGITDTSVLATASSVASAVATHEADTTAIHGITDTAQLMTLNTVQTTTAGKTIAPAGASAIPLTVKGFASQSGDLQEWQDSASTIIGRVTSAGYMGVGPTGTPLARLHLRGNVNADRVLLVQNNGASQTGDYIAYYDGSTIVGAVDAKGRVGVLGSAVSDKILQVTGTYPGTDASVYAIASMPTFPATTTGSGTGFYARVSSAPTAFTMSIANGMYVDSPQVGAGSAITTANGIRVANQGAAGITTAYGVRIDAQSGAGTNYGLWHDDGGDWRIGGRLGLRANPSTDTLIQLGGASTHPSSATTIYGLNNDWTAPATATSQALGVVSKLRTAASAFTIGTHAAFQASAPSLGAGSAITSSIGLNIGNMGGSGITNSYGINITAQSGSATGNYGVYHADGGMWRIGGQTGIRCEPNTDYMLRLAQSSAHPSTATTIYDLANEVLTPSTATSAHYGYLTRARTAAASFTLTNRYNLYVDAPIIGASSTISNNYGLYVSNQGASGVTNAYGIRIANQTGAATLNYAIWSNGGKVQFDAGAAGVIPLVLQGAASQTANLQEWQDSGATALLSVTSAGIPKWNAAGNQQTTVGAAGGASALPATPTKYLKVVDSAGTTLVVPAYAAS